MNTPRSRSNAFVTAVALLAFAGCGDLGSSSRRGDDYSRRSEPRYEDGREPRYDDYDSGRTREPRYDDRRADPVGPGDSWHDDKRYDRDDAWERDTRDRGQRANANVPRGVREAAVGKGTVSYRVTKDGRVFVTDSEFDTVIWSGKVYEGEVVEVAPRRDRVFVDRREVAKAEMKDDIRYRIYYDRDRY